MMKRRIRYLCGLLCACLLGGCAGTETPGIYKGPFGDVVYYPTDSGAERRYYQEVPEVSLAQVVSAADIIVDAELLGFCPEENDSDSLVFQVKKVYKNAIGDKNEILFVGKLPALYRLEEGEEEVYVVGQEYMLFLDKFSSVYNDYDKYTQRGSVYVPKSSKNWKKYHTETEKILSDKELMNASAATEKLFVPFTASDKVSDAIEIAESIFVVKIQPNGWDSGKLTEYKCVVTKTILGTPKYNGNITVVLYTDQVKEGEEYLVLLCNTEEISSQYMPASRNSVFSLDEAAKNPELAQLLKKAVDYSTVEPEKLTDAERLEAEMKANAEELAKNPELKAQLEAELERLKEAEKTQD